MFHNPLTEYGRYDGLQHLEYPVQIMIPILFQRLRKTAIAYEGFKNLNISVKGWKFYNIFLNIYGMTIEQKPFG